MTMWWIDIMDPLKLRFNLYKLIIIKYLHNQLIIIIKLLKSFNFIIIISNDIHRYLWFINCINFYTLSMHNN